MSDDRDYFHYYVKAGDGEHLIDIFYDEGKFMIELTTDETYPATVIVNTLWIGDDLLKDDIIDRVNETHEDFIRNMKHYLNK